MKIEIRPLTPDLEKDYFDFFEHRAFSDGSPFYPCYCNAFNMKADEIIAMCDKARVYGGETEGWKRALRESAVQMLRAGKIRGYLAYDGGIAIGWCNANDRLNYYRVGAFDLDQDPTDQTPSYDQGTFRIKSVVCFEISPDCRGKGIAGLLLEKACTDAQEEGYDFMEGYPTEGAGHVLAFTGPLRLYEKAGFTKHDQNGRTIVMRKTLK